MVKMASQLSGDEFFLIRGTEITEQPSEKQNWVHLSDHRPPNRSKRLKKKKLEENVQPWGSEGLTPPNAKAIKEKLNKFDYLRT